MFVSPQRNIIEAASHGASQSIKLDMQALQQCLCLSVPRGTSQRLHHTVPLSLSSQTCRPYNNAYVCQSPEEHHRGCITRCLSVYQARHVGPTTMPMFVSPQRNIIETASYGASQSIKLDMQALQQCLCLSVPRGTSQRLHHTVPPSLSSQTCRPYNNAYVCQSPEEHHRGCITRCLPVYKTRHVGPTIMPMFVSPQRNIIEAASHGASQSIKLDMQVLQQCLCLSVPRGTSQRLHHTVPLSLSSWTCRSYNNAYVCQSPEEHHRGCITRCLPVYRAGHVGPTTMPMSVSPQRNIIEAASHGASQSIKLDMQALQQCLCVSVPRGKSQRLHHTVPLSLSSQSCRPYNNAYVVQSPEEHHIGCITRCLSVYQARHVGPTTMPMFVSPQRNIIEAASHGASQYIKLDMQALQQCLCMSVPRGTSQRLHHTVHPSLSSQTCRPYNNAYVIQSPEEHHRGCITRCLPVYQAGHVGPTTMPMFVSPQRNIIEAASHGASQSIKLDMQVLQQCLCLSVPRGTSQRLHHTVPLSLSSQTCRSYNNAYVCQSPEEHHRGCITRCLSVYQARHVGPTTMPMSVSPQRNIIEAASHGASQSIKLDMQVLQQCLCLSVPRGTSQRLHHTVPPSLSSQTCRPYNNAYVFQSPEEHHRGCITRCLPVYQAGGEHRRQFDRIPESPRFR